jgi:hypothetical protein
MLACGFLCFCKVACCLKHNIFWKWEISFCLNKKELYFLQCGNKDNQAILCTMWDFVFWCLSKITSFLLSTLTNFVTYQNLFPYFPHSLFRSFLHFQCDFIFLLLGELSFTLSICLWWVQQISLNFLNPQNTWLYNIMAVKTRRKNGGGMMGFRFMDTGSLPTLIGPASLFEGHVTQTAEDLNSRFMYWRTPKISTAPCKWYVSLCVCVYT